jgi:hypothetical protein
VVFYGYNSDFPPPLFIPAFFPNFKQMSAPKSMKMETELLSHTDKLATVSKVLMDQRVLEQRKEIEMLREENKRLQLQLFWRDHEVSVMESLMMDLNTNTVGCKCNNCRITGRFPAARLCDNPHVECRFNALFEGKLVELGLTFHHVQNEEEWHPKFIIVKECDPLHVVYNDDFHLVNIISQQPWYNFCYGRTLWEANDVNDPEVHKLAKLFEWMKGAHS